MKLFIILLLFTFLFFGSILSASTVEPPPKKPKSEKEKELEGKKASKSLGEKAAGMIDLLKEIYVLGLQANSDSAPPKKVIPPSPSTEGFEGEWPQPYWWTKPPPWVDEIPPWFSRYIQHWAIARSKRELESNDKDPLNLFSG
eukprot:c3747_g1_i1.p1 GENE.c3747_g1_i1~~c3747_g1_i1.p1  ORF type:complete len:143 (+),score=72.77 c3747_g1_i1:78-506(+)